MATKPANTNRRTERNGKQKPKLWRPTKRRPNKPHPDTLRRVTDWQRPH